MKKIIETKRCYLRELCVDDAQDFYDLNEDFEVVKYTGDSPFSSLNDAKIFLQNYDQYQLYGYGRWAVIDKETGNFLGWCGLKYSSERNDADLGYRFFRNYWGKGYATETAKACIAYGFKHLKLQRIVGRVMEANVSSIKVLEKIGMEFKGKFELHLHDGMLYQIENNTNHVHSGNL